MNILKKMGTLIALVSVVLLSMSHALPARAADFEINELKSGYNWASNFESATSVSPTVYFGAYAFHEFNNELYIGLGAGRPADTDGGLIMKYNGSNVTTIGELDEQGVNEIVSLSDRVVIGGVDPAYADDWTNGNVYISTGTNLTKYRSGNGLTNVIHMWGLHADGDTLYAAVSAHDGTNPTTCTYGVDCFGEVYKSTNKAQTWAKLATLGEYRVFDIAKFNGDLYANYVNTVTGDSKVSYSTNDGANWTSITLPATDGRRTHFVEFNNTLLMVGGGTSANKLYALSPDHTVTTYDLPFSIGHLYDDATHFSNYNQLVVVNGYLYAIDRTGGIRRTADLINWYLVADTPYTLISIGYWQSQNKLVISDTGTAAKLYAMDLPAVASNTSNSSGAPARPDITAGQGGIVKRDGLVAIIDSQTAAYDLTLVTSKKPHSHPFHIGVYWQVSPIQEIWLHSFFNGAKVYDQQKPSILALHYQENQLTVDASWYARETNLKLAISTDEGKTWRLVKQSVVDPDNNTVATRGMIGGWYALVSSL